MRKLSLLEMKKFSQDHPTDKCHSRVWKATQSYLNVYVASKRWVGNQEDAWECGSGELDVAEL